MSQYINIKRGFSCSPKLIENGVINKRGQGLYIWTSKSFIDNSVTPSLKVGQYGANSAMGKTPIETIESYVGTTYDEIIILYALELSDYLKSDRNINSFKNAFDIEHIVHKKIIAKGGYKSTSGKSTEVFNGIDIHTVKTIINETLYNVKKRDNFDMRPEQKTAHDKIINYLSNGGTEFLLAAKMRFGKNFTILNAAKTLSAKNILFITYKPHVFSSLQEDIENHVNFNNWEFINIKDNRNPNSTSNKTRVFGVSAQLAQYKYEDKSNSQEKTIDELRKNLNKLSKIKFDIIIADEYHYGTSTHNFKAIIKALNYNYLIYVSGTAMKDIAMGRFNENQIYSWDYIDEQREKLNGSPQHQNMPTMNFHLINISEKAKSEIQEIDYTDDEQFNMEKLISVDENGELINSGFMEMLLKQIIGKGVRKELSPYAQVSGLDHTLWSLPKNTKGIQSVARMLRRMPEYSDFIIIEATSNIVTDINTIKEIINKAKIENKRTITLTCYRFKEGVTVKDWNAAFMLDSGKGVEEYFQTIFRGQSPGKNKDNCYVFDFNPQRALQMIYDVSENRNKTTDQNISQNIKELLDYAPVLIQDENKLRKVDFQEVIENFRVHGSFSEKFANVKNIHTENLTEEIINNLKSVKGGKRGKKFDINNNDIPIGKTSKTDKGNNSNKKQTTKSLKKYIQKIQMVLSNIPEYLFNSPETEENIEDILKGKEKELFYEITGITIDTFKFWVGEGLIDITLLNRNISYFKDAEVEFFNSNPTLNDKEEFFNRHFNMNGESGATPQELVNQMLDKLPSEVWEDPLKTFCDPCMGTGTFIIAIKERLMKGLSNVITNPIDREKHILENMIWGIDINKSKYLIAEKLFNPNEYNNNLSNLDTLKINFNNMPKFDVVVGNPPFQSQPKNKFKANRGSSRNLYQKFIDISIKIVKSDKSIISYITPPGFLKSTKWGQENIYFYKLKKRGLKFLKLKGVYEYFNVRTPICYFISYNNKNNLCEIESDENVKVDLTDKFFIPSSLDKCTYDIFYKISTANGQNLKFKRSKIIPENYIGIKAMNNRLWGLKATNNLKNISVGNDLIWKMDDQNIIRNIIELLNNKIFTYLIRRTQYDAIIYFNFINGWKIPNDMNRSWSDKEIYEFYNFNKDEINIIENSKIVYLK